MIDILTLFRSVLLLLLMILPGILMQKTKMASEGFAKSLSKLVLYIAQPAMIIEGFIQPYNKDVLIKAGMVLLFSVITHLLFTLIAFLLYRKGEEGKKRVLRFATVFTNSGYMGIPLLIMLFSDKSVAIYASVYCIVFNVFVYTLGCFFYTQDRSYISIKKAIINPATIATIAGIVIFLLPIDGFFTGNNFLGPLLYDFMGNLSALVAPLSMMIIGIRLAEIDLRGVVRDLAMYRYLLIRMFLSPILIALLLKLVGVFGYYDDLVATVVLLCAAAPPATATAMFAELCGGDSIYAGQLVSAGTILSIVSMPVVALLLLI